MRVLALKVILALVPTAIICHRGTLFQIVNKEMGRSPEVLLPVSIVAFRPLMLFINKWTKTSFVGINHEFFYAHIFLILI